MKYSVVADMTKLGINYSDITDVRQIDKYLYVSHKVSGGFKIVIYDLDDNGALNNGIFS